MNKRIRRVQAVILMVLLAFLLLNAKMVAANKEAIIAIETTPADYGVRAGVILVLSQAIEELPLPEATVVAPEKNYSRIAEDSTEEIESTQIPESSIKNIEDIIDDVEKKTAPYSATEEEVILLCKLVVAEARGEDIYGQELVARASINNAIYSGCNLIQDIQSGRYSSVINGVPCKGGNEHTPVTEEDITPQIREAVQKALEGDYTEPLLQMIAEENGLDDESFYIGGARYFYNPKNVIGEQKTIREEISVSFQYQSHVFYASWN